MVQANFALLIGEIIILLVQFSNWISSPFDKSRLRFLLLTVLFIMYNTAWHTASFLLDKTNPWYYSISLVMGALVFILCCIYLIKELKLNSHSGLNKYSITVFILSIVISVAIAVLLMQAVWIFYAFVLLVLFLFGIIARILLFDASKALAEYSSAYRTLSLLGLTGLILLGASVILFMFSIEDSPIGILLGNTGYILLLSGYITFRKGWYLFSATKVQGLRISLSYEDQISNKSSEDQLKAMIKSLSTRERQIAYMILSGLTFNEMSKKSFTSVNTLTKQASEFYPKLGCSSKGKGKKKEFIQKFKHLIDEFQ